MFRLRRMRALGFAGSVLLALGGSALSRQPIQALNNVPSGLANAAALLGTFLMIIAWIAVCRRTFVASDPNVSGLVGLAVLWSVPFLFLPPIFSDDAWVYAANSLIVANGDSPYLVTPGELAGPISDLVHPNWREIPARYGPVHFLLSGALGVFTESPHLLVVGHRLLALGGLVGLAWGLARLAPLAGRRSADAVALVVLSPLVLGVGVASPHNDLVMTGLAFAGLGLASVGRHWTATLLLGAAVGIKPPVGLLVLVLACLWE
ncbi:MAG: polyprenol phosphomannose-dependent alpha 1,6 mannosyltransferase MptB, partial [Nocardioides sp.]